MDASHRAGLCLAAAAAVAFASCAPAEDGGGDVVEQLRNATFVVADSAFGDLPGGRAYGASSAVHAGPDGMTIWVADRCGQNTCFGREDMDPIFQFDLQGNLLQSFGAGMFLWPHGIHVDQQGNVWVTDAARPPTEGRGHVVYKFSPNGQLLMTLGQAGVTGNGQNTFDGPTDVLVAPDGTIFVADGHGPQGTGPNNRIVVFSSDGQYIKEWGTIGEADGQIREPHSIAMDSQGRVFVGDRQNNRIRVFDRDGNHIASWRQFGRPSGIYIDPNDILYSADSESNSTRNPGGKRGLYIGGARTGELLTFVPDPEPNPETAGTSGAEGVASDVLGNVYGAEVGPQTIRKYVRASP